MKALRKPYRGPACVVDIDNSLASFQGEVNGFIQVVSLYDVCNDELALVCNEEGLLWGLPYNFSLPNGKHIVGNALFVREAGEDFCALTNEDIKNICEKLGFELDGEPDEDR